MLDLLQYPEAKVSLMERGEQLLKKDNLLDEEALKEENKKKEDTALKLARFGEVQIQAMDSKC